MAEFVEAANELDLKEGEGKVVEARDKTIALFKKGGKFYAIDNTCAHMGGPLGEGTLDNDHVVCPWHGWTYDIKTGETAFGPRVETYNVKVENGKVFVEI